jgi:hypothetical protein
MPIHWGWGHAYMQLGAQQRIGNPGEPASAS